MTTPTTEQIRDRYRAFLASYPDRVLLTGHSHQAWPDVARSAMNAYFDDSARHVDDKWSEAVFARVDTVGRKVLERSGFSPDDPIAFGRSTHELVFRLLTALPRDARVVSTTGEFHSLHRQLTRLEEDGLRVAWIDGTDRAQLADRLVAALVPGVALVAVSAVFFEDSALLPGLDRVLSRAVEVGAIPLVDAYHAFNVVPIAWGPAKEHVYVVAGGYKYAAFGEGICWLRFPRECSLRPAYTGWFADFDALERPRSSHVGYGAGGARFAGATFDAASFYRAESVLSHWDELGLDVAALRAISSRQTQRLVDRARAAGLDVRSPMQAEARGGFVTVRVREAHDVVRELRARGVFVDARGELLRLGPAPYTTEAELDRGVDALVDVCRARGDVLGG